jgi:Na+/H+ antiporter NhaD/arsenite permease-like protein
MEHPIANVPLWASIPFMLMLLTIAVAPLAAHHWWENNRNKLLISIALGLPVAIYLITSHLTHALMHQLLFDYIPFIVLLGALFVITGGINLSGDLEAKPATNTTFLAIGAILASFMGTTGAAMLLIRPVIKTNSQRKYKVHTILFFIAIVANAGGLLSPLGDPPLFLLYLRSAPFTWFFGLIYEWVAANSILLLIYFLVDSYYYRKEPLERIARDIAERVPLSLAGSFNFIFLAGVVLSVAFLNQQYLHIIHDNHYYSFIREAVILACLIASILLTPRKIRIANNYTWEPIKEVAYLFLGIFTTMVPALLYLQANAQKMGLNTPVDFYYATGLLSSFLDNAPTALSFHNLALGLVDPSAGGKLVAGIPEPLLVAISVGAVFFGAMTYIGNGPNFMVKAIAEENKIEMPSFFGYIFRFSLIVLLPVFIIVQLLLL